MRKYKAMLFDLDDTLLDRNQAVDNIFIVLLEECYGNVEHTLKAEMLRKFKMYDNKGYGVSDKTAVFEAFFDEFPPVYRLPQPQEFWNQQFPQCFSISEHTVNLLKAIQEYMKVAIITNGTIHRQKAKIVNTGLHEYFDVILISEEVGLEKPDPRIFHLALNKLQVQPEDALFVGDNLVKDVFGPQAAGLKGIWFNPSGMENDSDIKPDDEIQSLDALLHYLTPKQLT
ncbi:HAD-IA family hydrolase [Bacillus sp. es.034]|uniref:HAD family hydrolase n=1 Tax=Bacillus sp. es.034 TaxID=1761763 RepID=UPI000BF5DA08|nr:HAD-IA family hydrolase [Bacillus sp. es.034]PFG05144.1 putative hydrolase of the HAD superfamily [Bacillus sp. es.034]